MAQLASLTPDLVGRRYPEFKFHVTAAWVRDYKEALGYPDERLRDEGFVPRTFVSCLRDAEFSVFKDLGLQLSQLLHAGQEYTFHAELRPGDRITSRAEISRLLRKRGKVGGDMIFLELRNLFRRLDDGAEIASTLTTIVVREEAGTE